MGINQEGSWLSEEWLSKDNFFESKARFHSVYDPLKDNNYKKVKFWDPKKEEFFYHVVGPENDKIENKEFIITNNDMIRSFGKYKVNFEDLKKTIKRDLFPTEVEILKATKNELKDMEEMIKDLNNDEI
jgi:hypothetical protein